MLNRGFIILGLSCLLLANIIMSVASYWAHRDIAEKERAAIQVALGRDRDLSVEIRTLSTVNKEAIEANRRLIQELKSTVQDQANEIRLLRWRLDRCTDKLSSRPE